MSAGSAPKDLYAAITDQIVAAIENGAGEFHMPWHRAHGSLARPWNITSGKRYRGINIVALWLAGEAQGYAQPIWGTYRQWQAKGAQVRRGERASLIVFYKTLDYERQDPESGETATARIPMARASHVFNAAQVDGYAVAPHGEALPSVVIDPIDAADHVVRASGAVVREGGDRAFFSPRDDFIAMPERARFAGSPTMPPTEAYYATLLHELTHWSGGEKRLKRSLSARFGDNAYAMEELVAELGASYLCADLGVSTELRPDHAAYIQTWLKVLRADKRAIFTAAARAQEAAAFLLAFAPDAIRNDPANSAPDQSELTAGDTSDPAPTPPPPPAKPHVSSDDPR